MFDDWINMGLLSQAYGLDADECVNLVQHIQHCKYGPINNNNSYDIKKIDDYAKKYTINLSKNKDKTTIYTIYYIAMVQWRNMSPQQINLEFEQLYKNLRNYNNNEYAFNILWPIIRIFFITNLSVNKKQAIQILYQNGYPLQKEVKGITHTFVSETMTQLSSSAGQTQQFEADTMATPANSNPKPVTTEIKTRERNSYLKVIAALAQKKNPLNLSDPGAVSILKAEIERCGLELGEKTIRKILKEIQDIT